ncbi:MAG: acetyl-CoA carboxylase biotin carboxylase subunit [Phycisphaerae bacterium]|nr:acetyl-CoA carboxylase biotin carboxylase subunit [Phycisphaerae bacterium]
MFKKVLIANRGEIAARIASTLQQMGVTAMAVCSEPDRAAVHVRAADEAYPLEGKTSAESYLRGERIIDIARRHGADAIHPGYGFLSENAEFAQAVANAGLVFIGPSPKVIGSMGDKLVAKETFTKAGVPVVPGWSGDLATARQELPQRASQIGYPVLIKAAAGGGGKGMRVVEREDDLSSAIEAAQREAVAAFGDGRVFLEKYIVRPRHVEIQIFGDTHGNVVHLFERECSIQRRHQKIIEESPSPGLTPELRQRMGEAAVAAAKAIGYTNAGTVEFVVDAAGNFYFLEVNTRLQVEHPVTEMVVQHDLVRAQVLVAAGEPLPFEQESLRQTGHAIECRICAEDASRGFLPSIGKIEQYVPPSGPFVRVDSGVMQGSEITVHYDPMLAKLIVWGRTRDEALDRMAWSLDRFVILGPTTNVEYLRALVGHPEIRAGRMHTQFLQEQSIPLPDAADTPDEALIVAALAARRMTSGQRAAADAARQRPPRHPSPWESAQRLQP